MLPKWPCHFGSSLWTVWSLKNLKPFAFAFYSLLSVIMASSSVPAAGAVAAAAEPLAPQDLDVDMSGSDSEWIQIKDEAVMVHDQAVREEQETTPFLSKAQIIESDDKPLSEKLREMEDALAKLTVSKEKKTLTFDDEAEVIEISAPASL